MRTAEPMPSINDHLGDADEVIAWAGESLESSLRRAILQMSAVWQLVMVGAVAFAAEVGSARPLLIAVHLGVGALALFVLAGRVPLWVLSTTLSIVMLVDWAEAASVDGALCLATAWMCNLANLIPAMLAKGREARLLSALVGFAVPAGLAVVHPDWTAALAFPAMVTGVAIRSAGRRALPPLRSFAERVDQETTAMWQERRGVAVARTASAEAAEQARIMHDTVVNTLAAVASGGAAVDDSRAVRDLCVHDLRTLDTLLEDGDVRARLNLDTLIAQLGLAVDRRGANDAELAQVVDKLPGDVVHGLQGALYEAMRNVVKHAGTGSIELSARIERDRLELRVLDRGVGFDGRLIPGRGLAESVFARAEAVGIDVELFTAPEEGTEIRLSCPITAEPDPVAGEPHEPEDFIAIVVGIRQRACWLWTAAVVAVGLVIESVNRFGDLSATYGMLAVVAAVGVLAWRDGRDGGYLKPFTTALVVLSVPAAFLLALAGIGFGRSDPILWQCLGASAPLAILLVQCRSRVPLLVALAGLVVTSAVTTTVIATDSAPIAATIPVGTAPALATLGVWWLFCRALEQLGRRAAREQVAAESAKLEHAQRRAAATAHRRWRHASLNRCRTLLQQLADGSRDATDPRTRSACADEERYLRQVMLLDPELFRSGPWFARALAHARDRDVRLVVRSGGTDVESDAVAVVLGRILWTIIGAVPAGAAVTASLFSTRGTLRFAVVAPNLAVGAAELWSAAPPGWTTSIQAHEGVDIIEIIRFREPAAARADIAFGALIPGALT